MSQKITGKNLSYDTTLPPFLARLRGQAAGSAYDGPDPQLVRNRRHGAARTGSQEAEDAPVVVDEAGVAVGDVRVAADGTVHRMTDGKNEEEGEAAAGVEQQKQQAAAPQSGKGVDGKAAGIGSAKKRKVGRVVGGDSAEGDNEKESLPETRKGDGSTSIDGSKAILGGNSKKKAKKVKLSFGDDEG